ncbi:MAG: PocR ligand-binding domain-containing protein [Desulfobacterales bacterium]|nr:PocR ligand-binding domain-containing protein [Desulfobacterales bacterium]
MKLLDLAPVEKWIELEKKIHDISGLNVSVFNTDGIRITNFQKWVNRLCPVIKANKKGQSFICSVAHQNIAGRAYEIRKPVVDSCDAGLVKIVVPIFIEDNFLGVVGGCGLLIDDNEVEIFLISKTTGIGEGEIESLSWDIGKIIGDKANSIIAYITEEMNQLLLKS